MINLSSVIITNITGVVLMAALLFGGRFYAKKMLFDERLFCVMVYLTIAQCTIEVLTFLIDSRLFPGARVLSVILNTLLFINCIVFVFGWTVYVDYKLFGNIRRILRLYSVIGIPALAVALLSVANLFTEVFFVVSPDNVYSRTPLAFLPYAVSFGYLIYTIILVYIYRRKISRYIFLPVAIFIFPIFVGSVIQFMCYGISLIWISTAVAMVSLYINLQNESYYIDALTGLYNRQYLTRYLNAACAHEQTVRRFGGRKRSSGETWIAGIMLDLDAFKSINDSFGHSVGDQALKDVGKLLKDVSAGGFAARYAGDEFIIIKQTIGEEELEKMMDEIRSRTQEFNVLNHRVYQITFSMGADIYKPKEDSVDDFLKRIDDRMYEEKRSKKSN